MIQRGVNRGHRGTGHSPTDKINMARPKRTVDRPFPWRCGNCGQEHVDRVSTPYTTTIHYDGRAYEVVVPDLQLPICANCGEVVFDNHTGHQINRVLRQQLGLL